MSSRRNRFLLVDAGDGVAEAQVAAGAVDVAQPPAPRDVPPVEEPAADAHEDNAEHNPKGDAAVLDELPDVGDGVRVVLLGEGSRLVGELRGGGRVGGRHWG